MTRTVVLWSVAAVLLFWGVGAYNRLMRLRAEANTAFTTVEVELGRQIDLVHHQLQPDATQPAPQGAVNPIGAALQAAASQLATNLATARHKPLDPERIAALGAAQDALATAWERAQLDAPDAVRSRRAQLVIQTHAATEHFNLAVTRYNEAITQFPALLLAFLFGFKPARALSLVVVPKLN